MWHVEDQGHNDKAALVVRVARGARRGVGDLVGLPLTGELVALSICVQGPEVLSDHGVPHQMGEQSLKRQAEAQPKELSLEEGARDSSQQPPAQLSHRQKRTPELWPKRGE